MTWVLWDILIPLIASFALGTLLSWLLWRGSRMNQIASEQVVTSTGDEENSLAMNTVLTDDEEAEGEYALSRVPDDSVIREMEKANITLISERDQAIQEFENIQPDLEKLRQRIVELETAAEAINLSDTSTDSSPGGTLEKVETASSLLQPDGVDSKELENLRADTLRLTKTLDSERQARRATELELLNFKNRHDKLANEFSTTVSGDEHAKAIKDRDAEIEALNRQLAFQAEVSENLKEEDTGDLVAEEAEKIVELEQPDNRSPSPVDEKIISVAIAAGIESSKPADPEPRRISIKNGHIPTGWTVPAETPSRAQRNKLTAIKGVGPVLEKVLHECGIYYYRQIANLDESGTEELQAQMPQFPGRIKRDKWVEQAKALQQKCGESAEANL